MSGTDGASHTVSEARPQAVGRMGQGCSCWGQLRGEAVLSGENRKESRWWGVLWRAGIGWRTGQGIHIGGKEHLRS